MISKQNIIIVIFFNIFFILSIHFVVAQSENKFIRRGNNAFEEGNFQRAEIDYRKALEKNSSSTKGEFNLGGAMYKQESFEEAAKTFESLAGEQLTPVQKAASYHNLGNSLMNLQQLEPAIEAYKNALRQNPKDVESRYNLEYAKRMLQQQQQQQQKQDKDQDQDQDQKDKKDQEDKQDKQDQKDKQDQEKKDEEQKQDQQQQKDQNKDNQDQQKQQQQQPKQISKEDAERMLQALKENEKKTLEKIKLEKLKSAKKVKSEKDW